MLFFNRTLYNSACTHAPRSGLEDGRSAGDSRVLFYFISEWANERSLLSPHHCNFLPSVREGTPAQVDISLMFILYLFRTKHLMTLRSSHVHAVRTYS